MSSDARLKHEDILQLREAAISAQLASARDSLLAGLPAPFVVSLPSVATPGEQLLSDLAALNSASVLADGTVPLATWLKNAMALAQTRQESSVFASALDRLSQREDTKAETLPLGDWTSVAPEPLWTHGPTYGFSDGTDGPGSEMGFGGADAFWDSPWDSPAPARSIGETADLFALLEGIPALRRPLTKRRWRRISESAPPELQHKWIEVVKPLLRHEHAVRPLLVAMWKQARLFGTVPAVGALEGRLDIDALARLYREKRAFWTYRPERPWHDVGPRARARAAAFDWEDGAWERSHFLAGPLFELIWEVMSEEEESSEAVEGIADQLDLAWWSAGGGTLDGAGVVFPWPAAELQTFSAQEYLAKQWNRAYQRARDFHEHTPEEERVADDLAFAYAEAHHVLWHRRADTASWTKDEHRWIQLVGHLRTVGEKDSSRCSRAMVRWTRAVPLLAAPESGLSQRSASAILEGAVLNDDLRRELRALRVARARLCMAGGDAEAMLDAFDAKHANHPWIERVEVEVGSRQTRDEDR